MNAFIAIEITLALDRYNRAWNLKLEPHLYDDRIIYSKTTAYQHLVITHDPTLDEYRFYINGNIQFSSTDEARYHESLVHPAMAIATSRKKILILGGGDGMCLREVLKYKDVESNQLVDLDPDLVKLCAVDPELRKLNRGAFDDARVMAAAKGAEAGEGVALYQETGRQDADKLPATEKVATLQVMNIDADKFLDTVGNRYVGNRYVGKRYNVVFIDLPDPSTIELNKLYTRGFYSKVRRLLARGGVMVVQSTSPFFARESYWCISRTISAAGFDIYNYHINVESFGDWGFVLATRDLANGAVEKKIAAMDFGGVETRFLTPEVFRAARTFGKDVMRIRHDDINTLMRPVLHMYYLKEDWQYD